MIKLGVKGKDKITGFEGIITGRASYIYGCDQYLLVPRMGNDNKLTDAHWFDEGRIEVVGVGIEASEVTASIPGGPNSYNPNRY
ncbi:MAG: hypothetical protein A3J24_06495 [Deltaproteobacteria bacterium RIFCSPLOWO2_02_FULL_53_8]|nr:MAG: hypothetical protein A3J24_06495 [Deltaproteobacteria bacterium RIFCSPLOWO2_02_FULL_53_8]